MRRDGLRERLALLGGSALLAIAVIGAIVRRPFRRRRARGRDAPDAPDAPGPGTQPGDPAP